MHVRPLSSRKLAILASVAAAASFGAAMFAARTGPAGYFEVELKSTSPGFAEVFYDIGRGMNGADAVSLPLRSGEPITRYRFPLREAKYDGLRFDPNDRGDCEMIIRNARLVDRLGRSLRNLAPADFKDEGAILEILTTVQELRLKLGAADNDPHLRLDMPAPIILRRSATDSWLLGTAVFLGCFVGLGIVGALCLLFVPRPWATHIFMLSGLLILVFVCARARFFAPVSFDEQGFLFLGWLVKNGSIPYRDFFDSKPPVIWVANALGLALFGLKGFLFRIVPTAMAALSILLFYQALIKRRIAPWLSVLLAAQVAVWLLGADFHDTGLNDSETYGFAFTLIAFSVGSLSSVATPLWRRSVLQVVSGICFGLAVLSKELFVLSVIPAWLLSARTGESGKWGWRHLLLSAAGGVAVWVLFMAYLVTHSALGRYWEVLQFNRAFAANYCIDIGRFPKVSGLAVIRQSWVMLQQQFYNVQHLAFVLSLGGAFLALFFRRQQLRWRWIDLALVLIAVLLGIVAVSTGHCFWRHYFLMGMMGLVLVGAAGAEALSSYLSGKRAWISAAMGVALFGLFLFVAKDPLRAALATPPAADSEPRLPQIVSETIEKHSKPGDYILLTDAPLVYIAMDRKSSLPIAYYLDEILSYDPSLQVESLREKLAAHPPRVLYLGGDEFYSRQATYRKLLFEPFLAEHHYVEVNDRLWYLPPDSDISPR